VGRYAAERLQQHYGKPFILENLPGAGGTTGTTSVLRAPSNGHVLLTQFTSALVTTGLLYKSARFDVLRDFTPIWSLQSSGTVLIVNTASPFRTLQDLLEDAKAHPDKITFGSAGNGSTPHMNAELFMRGMGIKLMHIPYRSTGQVLTDLLGGHVDCFFSSISSATSLIAAGRVRGLAVLRSSRAPELPEVPTLSDLGVSGWEPPRSTFGLFATSSTPRTITDEISAAMTQSYNADVEGQDRLKKLGLAGIVAGADLAQLLAREFTVYKKLISDANITIES
jgi:tripartite-type tricarboxylate transporter receptor subunit TctC